MSDRITLKEVVSTSLHSSHMEPREHECAIDRVGALARAGKLSARLWAWKFGGDPSAGMDALNVLVRIAAKRLKIRNVGDGGKDDYTTLRRACEHALLEWFRPQCSYCHGAGEMVAHDLKVVCHACGGSKVRRYTDGDRLRALNLDSMGIWSEHMTTIISIITHHEGRACATVRRELER